MYNFFCFITKTTGELAMDESQAIQILRDILIDKSSSSVLKTLYSREPYELIPRVAHQDARLTHFDSQSHQKLRAYAQSARPLKLIIDVPKHEWRTNLSFNNTPANSIFEIQLYDSIQATASQWRKIEDVPEKCNVIMLTSSKESRFELGELDTFDCSKRADIVPDVLAVIFDAVASELSCTATEGVALVNIACDMVESLNNSSRKRIQNAEKQTD
ncbi:uncharacterized protein EAE97_010542 [Botrytis byssoidea]|uniref:Uncharacterized protein n=1 Tax=Botrytis byssoidea TaxID=139641 RepID=A0A9P5LTH5_9HELO|nr:uncharacterized protein EAE97_010542 [Botrytis byssoidea]KAF7925461.1 hypothetical protein EAE97_010542 [Botrytis byssoidea]